MFKLIVVTCLISAVLGAHLPKTRPQFSISGKPIFDPKKIVGGQPIDISKVPYQIALEEGGYLICGGSIIGNNRVLTAAHCTDGASASDLKIRTGSSKLESGGTVIQVKTIRQNPNYGDLDYDASVLILAQNINLSNVSQAIELASTEPKAGATATVSGWGTTSEGGSLPSSLRSVDVPIISRTDCDDAYGDITPRQICAGVKGKDSCQGDSGGPLTVNGKLAGIVSWGIGCAEDGYPGVYSNVAALKDWIDEQN